MEGEGEVGWGKGWRREMWKMRQAARSSSNTEHGNDQTRPRTRDEPGVTLQVQEAEGECRAKR